MVNLGHLPLYSEGEFDGTFAFGFLSAKFRELGNHCGGSVCVGVGDKSTNETITISRKVTQIYSMPMKHIPYLCKYSIAIKYIQYA